MNLRVIIAGAGRAGAELHLTAYRHLPDVEVIGICDADITRAQNIAQTCNIPNAFISLEEALQKTSADLVSICTPPHTHFALCRQALHKGCHILVEKPIFTTLGEADEIHDLATAAGKHVCAVHNQKYQIGILKALDLFAEGSLGAVHQVHAVWMVNGNNNRMIADKNFWCHKLTGGRWEEMIAHPIYKAYQFLGKLTLRHLGMKTITNRWPWLPADELELMLDATKGLLSIKLSANTEKYNFLIIYGSKRAVYVDAGQVVDIVARGQPLAPKKPNLSSNPAPDTHRGLIRDFILFLNGEQAAPPVTWEEASNTLALVLDIGRAIQHQSQKTT